MSFRNLARISLSLLLFMSLCGIARAETAKFEIQSVVATDPGKKPAEIPESLKKYKKILESYNFGTFKDTGRAECKMAVNAKDCVTIGVYTVEIKFIKVEHCGAIKVTVTIREDKKIVYAPVTYYFKKEQMRPIEIAGKDASKIFILTLQDIE